MFCLAAWRIQLAPFLLEYVVRQLALRGSERQIEKGWPTDLGEIFGSCVFHFPGGVQKIPIARRFRQDGRKPLPEKTLRNTSPRSSIVRAKLHQRLLAAICGGLELPDGGLLVYFSHPNRNWTRHAILIRRGCPVLYG